MSGTFRNDISTTGFITSKKVGPVIGSVMALPTPSEEYEGKTLQYLGEDVGLTLRKSNMYICKKQEDGTYIWVDNSPAGGGVWGKIIGNPNDQGDLVTRIQSIIDDSKTSTDFTWSANNLLARFTALEGVVNVVVVETLPATLVLNTIYYVGTEPNFNIKLYANNGAGVPTLYDMGSTTISFSDYYNKYTIDGKFTDVNTAIRLVDENKAGKTGYVADKVLITSSTGAMSTSTATSTELGYLEGATSNIQTQIGNKQNTVTYGTEDPSPTAGVTGDLYIKDATDGVWSRVNPETIIDDSALSGSKTFSSNLLNNKWNQMDAAKQNRVLTGTADPSPTAGVLGDIYIKYGEEDTWSRVEANNIIKDGVTATTSTWSSSELKSRFQALAGGARVEMVAARPETGVLNTTYYVGTASPYHIWLYANNSSGVATWFDLGVTSIDFSDYYKKTEADGLFLRQTGGPLTGAITAKDLAVIKGMDDSGYITMMGGSGAGGGAYLDLIGKDYSSDKGSFVLHASNGTVNNKLIGGVDGSLTWMGKTVMISGVEDITAEFFQNDTMTGHHKATKYGKMITVAVNGCSHTDTLFTMLPKYRPAGPMTICINAIAFPDGEMSLVQLQGDSGNAICYGDKTKNWYWSCTFVIA